MDALILTGCLGTDFDYAAIITPTRPQEATASHTTLAFRAPFISTILKSEAFECF